MVMLSLTTLVRGDSITFVSAPALDFSLRELEEVGVIGPLCTENRADRVKSGQPILDRTPLTFFATSFIWFEIYPQFYKEKRIFMKMEFTKKSTATNGDEENVLIQYCFHNNFNKSASKLDLK